MIVNINRADKDVYRVEVDDKIVGFAIRMTNNTWKAFGPEMSAPLVDNSYKTPKAAAKAVLAAVS